MISGILISGSKEESVKRLSYGHSVDFWEKAHGRIQNKEEREKAIWSSVRRVNARKPRDKNRYRCDSTRDTD